MITVGGLFIGTAFGATWSDFALNRQEVTNTPLASSDDSSVIQMMEQDMAKLPLKYFDVPMARIGKSGMYPRSGVL